MKAILAGKDYDGSQQHPGYFQTFDATSRQVDDAVGPASYQIGKTMGKANIPVSHIKACPQFSFSRSNTHRTIDGRQDSKSPIR